MPKIVPLFETPTITFPPLVFAKAQISSIILLRSDLVSIFGYLS